MIASALIVGFARPIARAAIVGAVAWTTGVHLTFGSLDVQVDRLVARDVHAENGAGETIADIGSFSLGYSLRDMFPGGRHAFGLTRFDIERAHVVIARHADGTLNLPLPKGNNASRPSAPMIFTGRIHDASVDVYDFTQPNGAGRHLVITAANADMNVDTAARSLYRARLTYVENGRSYPLYGSGDVNIVAGFGEQHWWSQGLPIARLANVGLDSPQLRVSDGFLRHIEARIVDLPSGDGSFAQHVSAVADLERGRIAIGGLGKPLRDVAGTIDVYGNGLLLDGMRARLAGLPLRFDGGVFDFGAPHVHVTMRTLGDFATLRAVLPQTANLPLRGPMRLDVTAEGPASKPLVKIAVRSPQATYGAYALSRTHALLAFDGRNVDVINFRTNYNGIAAFARGRLSTRAEPGGVTVLAGFDARSTALPYARGVVPDMPVHGVVVATGDRPTLLTARGIVYAESSAARLAAAFDVRSDGVGSVGPLRFERAGASLYAIARADRPQAAYDAYVRADGVRVTLPRLSATIDANVAARLRGSALNVAGTTNVRDAETAMGHVADVSLRFGRRPGASLAAGIDASGIGNLGGVAAAVVAFDRGTLHIDNAAAAVGGSFADVRGNVYDVQRGAPRYDLWTNLHSADLAGLAAIAHPGATGLVEGSAEARLHVTGEGTTPKLAGTAAIPEGAVNGLAFHDLRASVDGTPAALALHAGSVGVGTTDVSFDVLSGATSQRISIAASHADVSDFNDFFDAGDMFGGEGPVHAQIALENGALAATSGSVALHDASLRGFDFGATTAAWHGNTQRLATTLALHGPFGNVSADGTVGFAGVDMTAHARQLDLSRWAALIGVAIPVAGLADADLTAAGRYPNLDASLNARVAHASVGRIPVEGFTIAATTTRGRGLVSSAALAIPHANVTGSGSFGLRPNDPVDLALHGTTENVAALTTVVSGKTFDGAGALDTTLRVQGSIARPVLDDRFTLSNARYGKLEIPHATGRIHADQRQLNVVSSEVDLRKGRLMAHATVPIRAMPFQIDPQNRPIAAELVADDVEASNIAGLLPKGTAISGRADGRVDLNGSVRAPRLSGQMTVAQGSFSGPQERVPITDATATLAFAGTTARLENVGASAGGGTLSADGSASVPNVHDLGRLAMALNLHARAVRLDMPQYVKGRFDGDLALARAAGTSPQLSGTMTLGSARIPVSALYNPKSSNVQSAPLPLGMDVRVALDRDVRVVSPNVDVGIAGSVHALGTLAAPQLAGTFTSTGGTVNFFRDFRVEKATVSFDPQSGVIPDVDVAATTYISDPQTNIALRVTGPATQLNVAFASDPSYDREQILGLLVNAQSVGAVKGVASTGGGSVSASSAVTNLAAGQLNTVFTRNLLEPLSVALEGGLGLQNVQITNDVQGGLGLNAVKTFGRYVSFVFTDTFNEARRQSWSLDVHPSDRTQLELTTYTSQNSSLLGFTPLLVQGLEMGNAATIPLDTGTNGIDVKIARKFP